jgi:D-amino peptidase
MRRLYISADIEGCAGVASQHALSADRFEWQAARQWMTNEVVAAAEAALAHGYDEVLVADGHGNAHNLLPDAMPAGVRLLRSWPRPLLQMEGIDAAGIAAAFFIGYHNGAMGEGGILAHTYSGGAFRDLRVNGVSVSEGYLNAALAGEFGVPVVLVTGDAETAADAARYAPGAQACIVKQSVGFRAAAALTPAEACAAIRTAAAAALAAPLPQPFVLKGPYRLEIDFTSRVSAEMCAYLPIVEQTGPCCVACEFETLAALMRFVSFLILFNPNGAVNL